jgi:suppressor of G2 allele of SKP1
LKVEVLFNIRIALYSLKSYANAKHVLEHARQLNGDAKDSSFELWVARVDSELAKLDNAQLKPDVQLILGSAESQPGQPSHIPAITQTNPASSKAVRREWYQSDRQVVVTLFIKNVNKESCKVEFTDRSLSVNFPLPTSGSEFVFELPTLYASIDAGASSYSVMPSKIEILLAKSQPSKWKSLEREDEINDPSPSDIRRFDKKNWDQLAKDVDEEGADDQGVNALFQQIYKDADDDTKKAMAKSYIESNGTALSTNWDDVKKGTVSTKPPEGMVAKRWDS